MAREKSPEVVARRMIELAGQVPWSPTRVTIKGRRQNQEDVVATGVCSNGTFQSLLPGMAGTPVSIVLRDAESEA